MKNQHRLQGIRSLISICATLRFCSGFSTPHELVLHTETYFTIVKDIFVNSTSSGERVGTLYLMYALYFKQPTKDFCKFRFTCANWEMMKSFYHLVHNNEQYQQAQHIFWRLWHGDAFRFVESDVEYNQDSVSGYRGDEDMPDGFFKVNGAVLNSIHNWQNEGILNALATLEVGYNEMKEHLTSTAVCTLTTTQSVNGIMAAVDNVKKLFSISRGSAVQSKSAKSAKRAEPDESNAASSSTESDSDDDSDITTDSEFDEASGEGDPVEVAESDIGQRRYEIKKRALGQFADQLLKFRDSVDVVAGADARHPVKQNDSDASSDADEMSIKTDGMEPPDKSNEMGDNSAAANGGNFINVTANGDIVINHRKKLFNRKLFASSAREQIASCPE